MTRSAVSQHLAVLHDSKLLSLRREGTRRLYRVRHWGAFYDDRLAELRDAAEAMERRSRRQA